MQQAAYSKKNPGLFFQCLGSVCTFNFIDKIVIVLYIVQIYAEKHKGQHFVLHGYCNASEVGVHKR